MFATTATHIRRRQYLRAAKVDAVRPKTATISAACTIVACLFCASTAFAQATGACCLGGLCGCCLSEADCLAGGGHYFGDGSSCALGLDECGACCNTDTGVCTDVTSDFEQCSSPSQNFVFQQLCSDVTTCALPTVCGNNFREGTEECDGTDDGACPGLCQADCTCGAPPGQVCGNNIQEGTEQCDGTDDAACPGLCQTDCTCPGEPIPTVSEWGMVILMLALLVGIGLKCGRRPASEWS